MNNEKVGGIGKEVMDIMDNQQMKMEEEWIGL